MAEENIVIKIKADVGITKEVIEAVTKAMEGLGKTATIVSGNVKITNKNLEDTNKILGQVGETAKKTTGAIGGAGDSVKKSNQQWQALSLVVQDLPYGFRGIQNNLPALLGGVAAVGGAAYFAFSAIVALYTAYGQQINDAILKTTDLEKAQRELGKSTIEAGKSTETARTEILKITSIVQAAKDGFIDKTAALQLYNEKLGDSFGKVNTLAEAEQALVDKSPKYVEALMLKAKAEFYFAKASEFAIKKDLAGLQDQTSALDKLLITAETIAKFGEASSVKGIIGVLVEGIGEAQSKGVEKVVKTAGAIADVLTAEGKKAMTAYFTALKESGLNDTDIQAIIDKLNKNLLKAKQKTDAERLKAIEDANNAETKALISTLDERGKKEYEAGLLLADNLEKMKAAGYTDSITYYAAYRQKILDIAKYYDDKEIKEQERISKEFVSAFKSETKQQESDFNQFYKTKMDLATGDLGAQKEILLQQRAQLEEGLVLQAISWDTYTKGVGQNVKAVADISSKITKEAFDSLMQMGNAIMNALGPSLDMLLEKGANIGDVLTSAFHSIIRQLAKVIISAGIAVALLAILFPGMLAKAGGAGVVFKGLISQGMGIGGLVGGGGTAKGVDATNGTNAINTIQTNSSGAQGGGNFILKGQDLVLALNRSESSLKLRRGA
jgi:hypothetical protein